jgi:hypothetical protein
VAQEGDGAPIPPVFAFPDDARWDEARGAVAFSVEVGEAYRGTAYLPVAAMRMLLGRKPTPAEAVELFHAHQARIERVVQRRIMDRRLDDDANVTLDGRDLAGR